MYWDDFRRKFKQDPRFQAVSTTKEREAMFKDHVKHHLGKKRASPTDEYMDLLRNTKEIRVGIRWRDAKRILEKDDRYYAIESKTEREDLFRDYLEQL
jgi:transcription elongation regulator 1